MTKPINHADREDSFLPERGQTQDPHEDFILGGLTILFQTAYHILAGITLALLTLIGDIWEAFAGKRGKSED